MLNVYHLPYPISGSPEGIVAAENGGLFFSRFYPEGVIHRVNITGTGSWIDFTFKSRRVPGSREKYPPTDSSMYIYKKVAGSGKTGWQFLYEGNLFRPPEVPEPTATPGPTPTPSPTPAPTPTSTPVPTSTETPTPTPTPTSTATPTPTPTAIETYCFVPDGDPCLDALGADFTYSAISLGGHLTMASDGSSFVRNPNNGTTIEIFTPTGSVLISSSLNLNGNTAFNWPFRKGLNGYVQGIVSAPDWRGALWSDETLAPLPYGTTKYSYTAMNDSGRAVAGVYDTSGSHTPGVTNWPMFVYRPHLDQYENIPGAEENGGTGSIDYSWPIFISNCDDLETMVVLRASNSVGLGANGIEIFRKVGGVWTKITELRDSSGAQLSIPDQFYNSAIQGLSTDGSTVIGNDYVGTTRACYWDITSPAATVNAVRLPLASNPGIVTQTYAVSYGGEIIIGGGSSFWAGAPAPYGGSSEAFLYLKSEAYSTPHSLTTAFTASLSGAEILFSPMTIDGNGSRVVVNRVDTSVAKYMEGFSPIGDCESMLVSFSLTAGDI